MLKSISVLPLLNLFQLEKTNMTKIKNTAYLVAYYYMRPKRSASTQIAGWSKDAKNLMYDEKVTVARRLSKADQAMAKIILDVGNKAVVRNGWNNDLSFDQLFAYFHEGYSKYTTELMTAFDPEYLQRFVKQPEQPDVVAAESATISSV
jgi:hypothetical protein